MRLRNNSKNEWLAYNCGNEKVDILPESEFTCSDSAGRHILRKLGAPAWVVQLPDNAPGSLSEQSKQEEEPAEAQSPTETPAETEEPAGSPSEVPETQDKKFCDYCDSKGGRHKLLCARPK